MKFSLKQTFLAATLLSVYCGLLFGAPEAIGVLCLTALTTCFPSVSVAGVVYGRGYSRAFWIGALGPSIPLPIIGAWFMAVIADDFDDLDEAFMLKLMLVSMHAAVAVGGVCAMGLRWLYGGRSPSWPCVE